MLVGDKVAVKVRVGVLVGDPTVWVFVGVFVGPATQPLNCWFVVA